MFVCLFFLFRCARSRVFLQDSGQQLRRAKELIRAYETNLRKRDESDYHRLQTVADVRMSCHVACAIAIVSRELSCGTSRYHGPPLIASVCEKKRAFVTLGMRWAEMFRMKRADRNILVNIMCLMVCNCQQIGNYRIYGIIVPMAQDRFRVLPNYQTLIFGGRAEVWWV